jgi:3-dehydroquinate synthase
MFEQLIITENKTSRILIGESIEHLDKYIGGKKAIVITDTNVFGCYKEQLSNYETIVIGNGESIKNYATVKKIILALIKVNADRSTFLVGVGGGIICDITGFVASIFMRGMEFGFVASSLLAQVDASVGGKNGVNFQGYKNMLGCFNQPNFVICDTNMLKTLPKEEISNALAEIVKHTLIADRAMFEFIEQNYQMILDLDSASIMKTVQNSVQIKAEIVSKDERESGVRRILNLGHTFGHAIEREYKLNHGHAVSVGLNICSILSQHRGYISAEDHHRIVALLKKLKLPVEVDFDWNRIFKSMKLDKKKESFDIHFVFLKAIGNAVSEKINLSELQIITDLTN